MHLLIRKTIACASALALSCSLTPSAALAVEGGEPFAPTATNSPSHALRLTDEAIDEMLQAGDYAEGEAIAVVDNTIAASGARTFALSPLDAAEPLMDVSAQAYVEATGEPIASPAANEGGASAFSLDADREPADAEALSIVLVKQEGESTDDLLRELAQDPRVVSVEPNYLMQLPEGKTANGDKAATTVEEADASTGDLTDYQWYEDNDGKRISLRHGERTTQKGFDINEGTWTQAKESGWSSASANASGTVAVMDTGIDYTHPDLQGVMWDGADLAQLADEGGRYGMNVSGSGDPADVMDRNEHGTHCAGIIASSWDGNGTSGIANGVQLIAVKTLADNGMGSSAAELRGYDYLARIATAVNLKAVNNSWGGPAPYLAFSLAVAELGRLGVVSVFATGNDALDTDANSFTAATLATSPYVVNVNSSDATGQLSAFSNYGAHTTDLAAPGSSILSTVPSTIQHFFPEASDAEQLAVYETFTSEKPCAVASAGGAVDGELHYDASPSLSVKLSDMKRLSDDELAELDVANGTNATCAYAFDLTVKVPEEPRADANKLGRFALKCLNPAFTIASHERMFIAAVGVEALDTAGNVQLALNDGAGPMSGRARMVDGWTPLSLDVARALERAGMAGIAFDEDGAMTVRMAVLLPYEPAEGDAVNLDCIGLGSGLGATGSYDVLSGTSMAAPVVTGAAAVLACGEATSEDVLATQDADALAAQAAGRAARLKGSTVPTDDFAGTCRSNGMLDLGVGEADMTPSITGAQAGEGGKAIIVNGYFFGEGGGESAISIDGEPCEVASWSANTVEASLPNGRHSGGASIELTASNGKTTLSRATLALPDDDPASSLLYEKTLASPVSVDGFMQEDPMLFSIVPLDGSLYLLTINSSLVAQGLWRYDIARDAWTRCADVPVDLDARLVCSTGSLAAYRGQVMLLGTEAQGQTAGHVMLGYRPESDTWQEVPCEDEGVYSSIAVQGDSLLFVGGLGEEGYVGIRTYDPQTGETAPCADLPSGTVLPSVAVSGKTLTIAQGLTDEYTPQPALLMQAEEVGGAWTVEQLDNTLPSEGAYGMAYSFYGLAGYQGGTALTGLPVPGRDTALLAEGAAELEPFDKTLSDDPVYYTAATAYDGLLYALGISNIEPGRVVFRATAVDTGSGEGEDPGVPGEGEGSGEGAGSADQEASGSDGAAAKPLASTGDGAAALAGLFGSLALAACAAITLAARRGARLAASSLH